MAYVVILMSPSTPNKAQARTKNYNRRNRPTDDIIIIAGPNNKGYTLYRFATI